MMKYILIISAFLFAGVSAGAEKGITKNDSALIKRMEKLEERVARNHKKIARLEKENASLKQSAGKQGVRTSTAPQKAVVTRRGSKQVVFE